MMKTCIRCFIVSCVIASAVEIPHAQMPDWKYYRDRAGNSYFIDKNGKVYTPDRPSEIIPPVSSESVEYHLNHGKQIIRLHPVEGLRILKSILILPEKNMIIRKCRADAGSFINEYKKRHGNRFEQWNSEASVLVAVFDGMTHLYDDELRFSLEAPNQVTVLKNRERQNLHYKYSGLTVGIDIEKEPKEIPRSIGRFDIFIFIDAESFPTPLNDIDQLEENWRNNIGPDSFFRRKISADKNRIIYEISHQQQPSIAGYEAFCVNGNIGYIVRIVCGYDFYVGKKDDIKKILDSFKTVRR